MENFGDIDAKVTKACQELIDALKFSLFEYKKNRPHLSWRSVAKNVRCNRYILNKILNDDGKISRTKTYDMFECFRIASILSQKEILSAKILAETLESIVQTVCNSAFTTEKSDNQTEQLGA